MSRSVLASRSAVLFMHAVFQVPSVVAVPSSRPVIASKRDGSCIPGLQSIRNNVRNEVSGQAPTDVTSGRVAVGYELIAGTRSLAMSAIVKASACRGAQRCAHAKPTPEKPTQRALTYDDQPSALISKKSNSVINSNAPRYRHLIRRLGPN